MGRMLEHTAAIAAAVVLLSGCDFVRSLAGRPTSADIAQMRRTLLKDSLEAASMAAETARLEAEAAAAQAARLDSLAVLDSLRRSLGVHVEPRSLAAGVRARLSARYYVILGSFSKMKNAESLSAKASASGFEVCLITMPNGNTAVGLCPSDSMYDAYRACDRIKEEAFCPAGVWIMDIGR